MPFCQVTLNCQRQEILTQLEKQIFQFGGSFINVNWGILQLYFEGLSSPKQVHLTA